MKLYLLPVGWVRGADPLPIEAYLVVLDDGHLILIDTGPTRSMVDDPDAPFELGAGEHVTGLLAALGRRPSDVDQVVSTHLDPDHCGAHDEFPAAEFVVQRRHLAEARTSGLMRYEWMRPHWEFEGQRWREVDGDVELAPGVELIESSGHVPGHQSVLVRLPETGPALICGDAIAHHNQLDPDARLISHLDTDENETRASTRRLVELARAEGALLLHSHDADQRAGLTHAPGCYT